MASALAAMFLAAMPAAAQQRNWRAASSAGSQRAFIDTASIARDGDKVRFMREIRMDEPRQFDSGQRYDRIGSLIEADCRARTLQSLEIYASLGEEVIVRGEGDREVDTVQAGSTADTDLRAACFDEWPRRP